MTIAALAINLRMAEALEHLFVLLAVWYGLQVIVFTAAHVRGWFNRNWRRRDG